MGKASIDGIVFSAGEGGVALEDENSFEKVFGRLGFFDFWGLTSRRFFIYSDPF